MTSGLTTTIQTASDSIAAPTASVAQGRAGAEVSSPVKLRPAATVSGLTSLGAGMQDMQLTSGLSGPQKQQTPHTSGVQLPGHQPQTQTEGVGESPAEARDLGQAVSTAPQHPQASAVGAASAVVGDNEVPDYEVSYSRPMLPWALLPLVATSSACQQACTAVYPANCPLLWQCCVLGTAVTP